MDVNTNERLVYFSDAVIAITITLLVLDLKLPEGFGTFSDAEVWAALAALWPRFFAYLISFAVISAYWINHNTKFRLIVRSDPGLMWINLLFLLTIGLVPFTTSLIAENDGTAGTAIYAGTMVASGLALTGIWLHANRRDLIDESVSRRDRQAMLTKTVLSSAVFAISIPLAFVQPDAAKYFWLLLIPINIVTRGPHARSDKKQTKDDRARSP